MPFKAVEVEYLNDFKTRFIIEVDLHNQLDRVYPLRPKIGAECLKSWRSYGGYQIKGCEVWTIWCVHCSYEHETVWTFHSRIPRSPHTSLQNYSICIRWIRQVPYRLAHRKWYLVLQYPKFRLWANSRYGNVPHSCSHPGYFSSREICKGWFVAEWPCAMHWSKRFEIRHYRDGSDRKGMTTSRPCVKFNWQCGSTMQEKPRCSVCTFNTTIAADCLLRTNSYTMWPTAKLLKTSWELQTSSQSAALSTQLPKGCSLIKSSLRWKTVHS